MSKDFSYKSWHGFDALQKIRFVEKAMVDGDVETAVGGGVKETVETCGFHRLPT